MKSGSFDQINGLCSLNYCYRLRRINAVCYSRRPAVAENYLSLAVVFHNCGRNCGKIKLSPNNRRIFVSTGFIPITVTVPAVPCKAIGVKTFQRIRIV